MPLLGWDYHVDVIYQPTSIPSGEAFGSATIQRTVTPSSILSEESVGTGLFVFKAVTVPGITSAEVVSTQAKLSIAVDLVGIPSAEQFGDPPLIGNRQSVSLTRIPSAEAFGTPSLGITIEVAFGRVWEELARTPITSRESTDHPLTGSERLRKPRILNEVIAAPYIENESVRHPQVADESFLVSRREWI